MDFLASQHAKEIQAIQQSNSCGEGENMSNDTQTIPMVKAKMKGTVQTAESGVVTTHTKNRFDVLDTASELKNAYLNLHSSEPDLKLALVPIVEDHEQSFSDGSGTRNKSNISIPKTRSEHNSEGKEERTPFRQKKLISSRKQQRRNNEELKALSHDRY